LHNAFYRSILSVVGNIGDRLAIKPKNEREIAMNDVFEQKVRAAAVALWWVVLFATAVLILHWTAYQTVMYIRPVWVLSMWGPNEDWAFVQIVWFWAVCVLKFIVWLMVLVALWLTLWARQLKKRLGG
jgi:hypothetical protein